jgi:hypothetical protein
MWNELNSYLDDDERLVYPDMYLKNRHLYDKIREVVYLIKQRDHPEARLQWVSELALPKALKEYDVDMLAKQLIVRLRLPWNKVRREWLCSQKELDANREHYQVLDIFLRVRRKDNSEERPMFDLLEFETNRDNYDIVEVQYLVGLKLTAETKARLLGIDPDSISTYMQQ